LNCCRSFTVVDRLLPGTARDRGIGGVDTDNGAGFVDAAAALAPLLATATLEPLRVPFSASGSVTPAASVVPGTLVPASLGASSPVSSDVRQAIPVGAHAVGLDVTFRWDDARASFQLFLERGAQRLGPLGVASRDGQGSVLAAHVEQALEQGDWDLVARSSGPSVATHYTVEGDVLVRAVAPTHARAAVEPFAGAASFLRSGPLGDSAAVTPWLVAAPLALLAALAWRRARSVEGMPWSLPLVEGRTGRSTLRGMSPAPGQRLPSRR